MTHADVGSANDNMTRDDEAVDYYEVLQISSNAEPDTIHRVYRLLAQRVHPDNKDTGDPDRFRALHEAYTVLSNPETRARYDIRHNAQKQTRWRTVSAAAKATNDVELEQLTRLTVLEVLCAHRRAQPAKPGIFVLDLEALTGKPREHLEFTMWYLIQKQLVERGDNSRIVITAAGVDYLEQHFQANLQQRRLEAKTEVAA